MQGSEIPPHKDSLRNDKASFSHPPPQVVSFFFLLSKERFIVLFSMYPSTTACIAVNESERYYNMVLIYM